MTRAEALDYALNAPENLTTNELYALHQALDREVAENRRVMGAVDREIAKREAAAQIPGPAHLLQTMKPGSSVPPKGNA